MEAGDWWILKILFNAFAGAFGLGVAILTFCSVLKGQNQIGVRGWFKKKWMVLEASGHTSLHGKVIEAVLRLKDYYVRGVGRVIAEYLEHPHWIIFAAVGVISPIVVLRVSSSTGGVWLDKLVTPLGYSLLGALILMFLSSLLLLVSRVKRSVFLGIIMAGFLPFSLFSILTALSAATILKIGYAFLVMLLLTPFVVFMVLGVTCIFPGSIRSLATSERPTEMQVSFTLGVAVSFFVSLFALGLGHVADPLHWIPKTPQMLISNSICDGTTLVATIAILTWALRGRPTTRIPLAVLVDVIVGAFLACCSLYFGLVFTEKALSVRSILNVLFAKSPDGMEFTLGPYFWIMHTTFLPTLVYMFVILMAWTGKVLLLPVRWFFGQGQAHKNPLRLTAALLGVFVAVFLLLARGAGILEEMAEKRAKETTQAAASLSTLVGGGWTLSDVHGLCRGVAIQDWRTSAKLEI